MTPVLFHFVTPTGVPIANTEIEIQLSRSSFDTEIDGVLLPRLVLATTDEDGRATVDLWPNDEFYYVSLMDPESDAGLNYKFLVPEVAVGLQVRLQDIVVVGEMSSTTYDAAALLVIQDAKAVAMTAAIAAQAAADSAGLTGAVVDGSDNLIITRGDATTYNAGNVRGPQGIQGETGLQGNTGSQGVQGIQGETGSQGIQGIQGETGAQGIKGDTGTTGDTGATGSQGIQGVQGDTGAQGIQGIQGVKGDTGAAGADGINGTNGSDGAAATITIGSVTTGAPGSSVTVVNSGTSAAAVLDIAIPRGEAGADGAGAGSVTEVTGDGTITVTNGTSTPALAIRAATPSVPGTMSAADKAKLDGVEASANNYSHPANHPPSIITQDASNRFTSDTEKATWDAKQAALGFTPEDGSNKSTNVTTDGASDTKYPSVKAVKTYADSLVVGLLDDRGNYDASVNTFPAAGGSGTAGAVLKGDLWYISVAGTLGGVAVAVGSSVRALVDTPAQTAGNWDILNVGLGFTPENAANKDASGGYVGLTLMKINFWNAAKTFLSFFTNTNTAARTYTFQDRDGTIADNTDLALKANLTANTFSAAQRGAFVTLTDASTVAVDFSLANQFNLSLAGNRTLGVPANVVPGQQGIINIYQDPTGSRTLAYSWLYGWAGGTAGTLSTPGASRDMLAYSVDAYVNAAVAMTIATPGVATLAAHGLLSGHKVQMTTTGALPTGLAINTTYWLHVIDANTFHFCTSLANVAAGTYIATSGSQSGVHTLIGGVVALSLAKAVA